MRLLLFFSSFLQVVKCDVVFTDHFRQFPIRLKLINSLSVPGLGIRFRIVNRNVNDQSVVLGASDAFYYMELIGVWKASAVKPRLVIESYRIDHQRVALPPSDRIAHPAWV